VETAPSTAVAPAMIPEIKAQATDAAGIAEELVSSVLQAVEQAGSRATVLEVEVRGNEVVVRVDVPESLVDMSMSAEAKRAATAAASRVAGRPLKLRLTGSTNGNGGGKPLARSSSSEGGGAGARGRAANDPVVKRMQEKFGAQIRTVIDHRDKR